MNLKLVLVLSISIAFLLPAVEPQADKPEEPKPDEPDEPDEPEEPPECSWWCCGCGRRRRSPSASNGRLSHTDASRRLSIAGISVSSSGNCHDPNNRRCTSLQQVRERNIRDIIWFKQQSGCPFRITGGTEIGHSGGVYSHGNGYKLDINLDFCQNNYIENQFTYKGVRSDGAKYYQDGRGNTYYKETSHWDILFN